jgi:endonuclease-8
VPEGDTIWKTAETLRLALAGRELLAFESTVPLRRTPAAGVPIRDVEARGKHLLIHFGDGTALHTHLRMRGSWHVYRTGETWRPPRGAMRVRIETAESQAVCFAAPVVEVLSATEVGRHPSMSRLGPDLTAPDPDVTQAAERLASLGPMQIGVALLDQGVAAGIGNVYKSEVLFACGLDPFALVDEVDPATRAELFRTAARLLRANARRGGPRSTRPGGGLAVYGRAGRPCPRCGTLVRAARQGSRARVTYWCPTCQPKRPSTATR